MQPENCAGIFAFVYTNALLANLQIGKDESKMIGLRETPSHGIMEKNRAGDTRMPKKKEKEKEKKKDSIPANSQFGFNKSL